VATLVERLGEPEPGRIQLPFGPRQVGKTTLLLQVKQATPPLGTDLSTLAASVVPATRAPIFANAVSRPVEVASR
jgi:hypothetical protein